MAIPYAAIRASIMQLMEGDLGSLKVPYGRFRYGVFEGQKSDAQDARVVQGAHMFDVEIGNWRVHEASPISHRGSYTLREATVTIRIWSRLPTTTQESERDATLARIASDCNDAVQALAYGHSLIQDLDSRATGIVGGIMRNESHGRDPEFRPVSTDWARSVAQSEIVGAIIVRVSSNEVAA